MTEILSIPQAEKIRFIRGVVSNRVKRKHIGRLIRDASEFTDAQIIESPEAAIVSIVESYLVLRHKGMSEREALNEIELVRTHGRGGSPWRCMNIWDYTNYRVRAEHKGGYQPTDERISEITSLSMKFIVEFYSRKRGIHDIGSASNNQV